MKLLLLLLTLMWDAGVVLGQVNNPNQCSRPCGNSEVTAHCYGNACCRIVNCQVNNSCPLVTNASDPCKLSGTACSLQGGLHGTCISSGKCCLLLDCTRNSACVVEEAIPVKPIKAK